MREGDQHSDLGNKPYLSLIWVEILSVTVLRFHIQISWMELTVCFPLWDECEISDLLYFFSVNGPTSSLHSGQARGTDTSFDSYPHSAELPPFCLCH